MPSSTVQSVVIARRRTDVKARSKLKPPYTTPSSARRKARRSKRTARLLTCPVDDRTCRSRYFSEFDEFVVVNIGHHDQLGVASR